MTSPFVTPKTADPAGSAPPPTRHFTFEEYCIYDDGTDNRYELVQGYLHLMSPPAGLHIVICEFLVYVFNKLFADTQSPLRAGREVGVRIGENTCRIVDVCVNEEDLWQQISQPGELGIFRLAQTPLLVVEVTSTNEKEDYTAKYQEYASIGILEYWIVNKRREQVRICNLARLGGGYRDRNFEKGQRIESKVLSQLDLTVDEVLDPPAVRQLIAQDQAQQAAERAAERQAFETEKTAIVAERAAEREAFEVEKTAIAAERAAEREAFEVEKTAIAAERDSLKRELEQFKALMQTRGLDPSQSS